VAPCAQTLCSLPVPPAKLPHGSSLQRAVPAGSRKVMNTRGGCGSVPRTCAASLPLWRRRRGVARAMTETTEQPRPPEVAAPYLLQGCCLAAVRAASPQQRCACRRPPMAPTTRRALKRHWAASRRACSASRWPPAPAPAPLAPSGPAGQRGPRLACQCACLADLRAPGVARPSAPRLGRGARGTGARRGVAGRARGPCHTAEQRGSAVPAPRMMPPPAGGAARGGRGGGGGGPGGRGGRAGRAARRGRRAARAGRGRGRAGRGRARRGARATQGGRGRRAGPVRPARTRVRALTAAQRTCHGRAAPPHACRPSQPPSVSHTQTEASLCCAAGARCRRRAAPRHVASGRRPAGARRCAGAAVTPAVRARPQADGGGDRGGRQGARRGGRIQPRAAAGAVRLAAPAEYGPDSDCCCQRHSSACVRHETATACLARSQCAPRLRRLQVADVKKRESAWPAGAPGGAGRGAGRGARRAAVCAAGARRCAPPPDLQEGRMLLGLTDTAPGCKSSRTVAPSSEEGTQAAVRPRACTV